MSVNFSSVKITWIQLSLVTNNNRNCRVLWYRDINNHGLLKAKVICLYVWVCLLCKLFHYVSKTSFKHNLLCDFCEPVGSEGTNAFFLLSCYCSSNFKASWSYTWFAAIFTSTGLFLLYFIVSLHFDVHCVQQYVYIKFSSTECTVIRIVTDDDACFCCHPDVMKFMFCTSTQQG